MNTLLISHRSERGGAENVLYNLLRWLPKDEFELFCLFPKPGPLLNEINDLGVKTFVSDLKWWVGMEKNGNLPYDGLDFCFGVEERVRRIHEIVRANNIELVVTNTIVVGEGALAARMAGVPHVWYVHEMLSQDSTLHASLPLRLFYPLVFSLTDSVLAVSEAVKEELRNHDETNSGKIKVIHNALERQESELTEWKEKSGSKEKKVVAVGKIGRRKGFLTLLRAAEHVSKRVPEAKFFVIGGVSEQDYYDQLLAERKRMGLENSFIFAGHRDNVYSHLRDASLFVLSSTCDPFPLALLEAMNAGLPVVATESGGSREAILDGTNGFLIPVDDDRAMADRIVHLLKDDGLSSSMGAAAHERIRDEFNREKYVNAVKNLFLLTASKHGDKNTSANAEMLLGILNSLGMDKEKVLGAIDFFEKANRSFPTRVYNRLGPFRNLSKRLLGL